MRGKREVIEFIRHHQPNRQPYRGKSQMLRLLHWLLFDPLSPKTRMTREDVMALAAKAAEAARIKGGLGLVTVRRIEGRVTWIASTPTKGSGWSVSIDDTTGEVGLVKRWGMR
jgi:hypothetical protein